MAPRRSAGFVFILTLLTITGVMTLMTVSYTQSMNHLDTTIRSVAIRQGFGLAEAGIACAIDQLKNPPVPVVAAIVTTCADTYPGGTFVTQMTAQGNNRYSIESTGTGSATATDTTLMALVQRQTSPFQQAAYATANSKTSFGIKFFGIVEMIGPDIDPTKFPRIDSYDSSLGAYGATLASSDPRYGTLNVSQASLPSSWNAEIRTNSSFSDPNSLLAGAIAGLMTNTVFGSAFVVGAGEIEPPNILGRKGSKSVMTFPSPVTLTTGPCAVLNDDLVVTGTTTLGPGDFCFPNIIVDGGTLDFTGLTNVNVGGTISVINSGTMTVQRGQLITNTLSIDHSTFQGGGGVLPVDVFVETLSVANKAALRGAGNLPRKLRLFEWGSGGTWDISEATVHGAFYAPNTDVRIGYPAAATVYGAIICKTCDFAHESQFSFDERLKYMSMPGFYPVTVDELVQYRKPTP